MRLIRLYRDDPPVCPDAPQPYRRSPHTGFHPVRLSEMRAPLPLFASSLFLLYGVKQGLVKRSFARFYLLRGNLLFFEAFVHQLAHKRIHHARRRHADEQADHAQQA